MLTLPSLWNIVVSTLAFFIAIFYLRRYLGQQGIPKGMTRSLLVLVLASILAWGVGTIADWADEQMEGPQAAEKSSEETEQLLKALGQTRP